MTAFKTFFPFWSELTTALLTTHIPSKLYRSRIGEPRCFACELPIEGLTIPVLSAVGGNGTPGCGCIAGNPFCTTAFIAA